MVVLPLVPVTPIDRELLGRMAPAVRRRAGRSRPAPRARERPRSRRGTSTAALSEHGDGPGCHRVGSEIVAVDALPGDAAEQRAGSDRPGVEHDVGDVDLGRGGARHLGGGGQPCARSRAARRT